MKILYVNHTAKLGGAERSLLSLIKTLQTEVEISVLLFETGELHTRLTDLGVECQVCQINGDLLNLKRSIGVLTLARNIAAYFGAIRKLRQQFMQIQPDLIHINSYKALVILSLLSKSQPVIFHSRDHYTTRLQRILLSVGLMQVTRIIAVSSFLVDENFPKWEKRSTVIRNGFEISSGIRINDCKKWPHSKEKLVFGILGEISYSKGIDRVFNIYEALSTSLPQRIEIMIYGKSNFDDDTYLNKILKDIQDNGYEQSIKYMGYETEINTIMNNIDIVLSVPRTAESFGRTIVEGMLHNKVVFALEKGGVTDIIQHGVHGFHWSNKMENNISKLKELQANGNETIHMLNRTREYACNQFDISRTAKEIKYMYRELT